MVSIAPLSGVAVAAAAALIFKNPLPPSARLALGDADGLRRDCEAASSLPVSKGSLGSGSGSGSGSRSRSRSRSKGRDEGRWRRRSDDDEDDDDERVVFVWDADARDGHQVARRIFASIVEAGERRDSSLPRSHAGATPKTTDLSTARTRTTILWFPYYDDSGAVSALIDVVRSNSDRLVGGGSGGRSMFLEVDARFWPASPATTVRLVLRGTRSIASTNAPAAETDTEDDNDDDLSSMIRKAVSETEFWVDDTLGRLSLCPYTRSMTRAAVGLSSVGVQEGPIKVRHSYQRLLDKNGATAKRDAASDAALLALAFWDGISELASTTESDLSTLLIVAPPSYDADFASFANACDELLEPSAKAVKADDLVGKAWFHPRYDASVVGHQSLLPGHALPPSMVERFIDAYCYRGADWDETEQGDKDDTGKGKHRKRQGRLSGRDVARANDEVRRTPHATVNLLRRSQLRAAKVAEAAASSSTRKPNAVYARNVMRIASEWSLGDCLDDT